MQDAARMIMAGEVEPVQLGAFLCVLRVRTEEPQEGAGFTRAVRASFAIPGNVPPVDLDWPSYAGKSRQLPWFLLAAVLLAQNGVRILMHGTEGHTEGRIYAREALESLGIPRSSTLADAARRLTEANLAFMHLGDMAPRLQEIIDLKPVLGLRSPVNTFARMSNPFDAPYSLQSVTHPNYRALHRDTAKLLGQPHMCVFKGDGGEVERRPHKLVIVQSLHDGEASEEEWPPFFEEDAVPPDGNMDISRLAALWRGDAPNPYAEAAIVGTVAIVLRFMGRAGGHEDALNAAGQMWERRSRDRTVA